MTYDPSGLDEFTPELTSNPIGQHPDEDWSDFAACLGHRATFEATYDARAIHRAQAVRDAIAVCRRCPVRPQCGEWANERVPNMHFGSIPRHGFAGVWSATDFGARRPDDEEDPV